jgi:hypothetical protein
MGEGAELSDMRCSAKRDAGCGAVAEFGVNRDIVGMVGPDSVALLLNSRDRMRHRWKRLVVDADRLRAILRRIQCLADHHRDDLADELHFAAR